MKIRDKLTIQFSSIFAFVFMVFCMTAYLLSVKYYKDEFDQRISERIQVVKQLFLQYHHDNARFNLSLHKENIHALPEEEIWIFDNDFNLLFRQSNEEFLISNELLAKIKKNKEINFEKNKKQYGSAYDPNDNGLIIVISSIDTFGISKIVFLKEVLIALYLIMLFFIVLLGRFFANEALSPISQIINQVKEIGVNTLYSRVSSTGEQDELSELADTFNNMLSRLDNAFKLQKMFISNVSHELRTPLTSLMGEVELALLKDRTPEEYKLIMIFLQGRLRDLNGLSNDMIKLVQVNFDISRVSLSPLRIDEIMWLSIAEIKKRIPGREIQVDIKEENNTISDSYYTIIGNKELLILALTNIIDNASKFSPASSAIEVDLIVREDRGVVLEIKDHGIGMNEEEVQHVFQPFFRSNDVRNIQGYGIGLALVEQIMMIHKTSVEILSAPQKGTTFRFTFPLK